MNLNKAIIVGNITKDPELKKLPNSDNSVCSFSIATNRVWYDKNSKEKHEQVEFHNIVAFGNMADNIAKFTRKGHQLLVEGRLATRSWEKDGKKNYRTEIVVESFQFGAKPKDGKTTQPETKPMQKETGPTDENPIQIDENDLPF